MAIYRLQAVAVIDDDAVSVDAEPVGPDYFSAVRRDDGHVLCAGKIESKVRLLVHFLAFVYVGSAIGEIRFGFRRRPLERSFPEDLMRGIPPHFVELAAILLAQFPIAIQKPCQK